MKYRVAFLTFIFSLAQAQAFAPHFQMKSGELQKLINTTNLSLLQSTQVVRALSDRRLDRFIEGKADAIQNTCADIKDTLSQLSQKLIYAKSEFTRQNNFAIQNHKFEQALQVRFERLEQLSQSSLEKCSEPEVAWILDLLRKETLETGFVIQSYQSSAQL